MCGGEYCRLIRKTVSDFVCGNAMPCTVVGLVAVAIAVALYFKFRK